MELVIVTGMSGAGKTQAINALEDIGFFCVDNVPPQLLSKFMALLIDSGGKIQRIALVVDVRSKDTFEDYNACLERLKNNGYMFRTLFLDCDDDILRKRYKETRRRHPLLSGEIPTVEEAIQKERQMLHIVKEKADITIDSAQLNAAQLKTRVRDLFSDGITQSLVVHCMSFGFKNGGPHDADLQFDVRCLPNPFYMESLREKSGLDPEVRDYVLSGGEAQGLLPRLLGLLDYLIPLYLKEGKSQLVVAVGCTGGKHRSVVLTELIAEHLAKSGVAVNVTHRDISKNVRS